MPTASEYRAKAVELYAQAQAEPNSLFRGELENLALAYRGLAELADRNAGVVSETSTPAEPLVQLVKNENRDSEEKSGDLLDSSGTP